MTVMLRNHSHSEALWNDVGLAISRHTGNRADALPLHAVPGGDINQAMRIRHGESDYFIKLNRSDRIDMFEAEAAGLKAIVETGTLRCPRPLVSGRSGELAYLVLEYLDMGGRGHPRALGEGLAAMHLHVSERFGWFRDNTIGATPQINDWSGDWVVFLRDRRLGFQLSLARERGHGGSLYDRGQELLPVLDHFFATYDPVASLLHGDLWGGNHGCLASGEPVIFDPAVYYGDRESDLAMTELFGGFAPDFYAAYSASWPLDEGYPVRCRLYQLYHVLNHLNLFGGGYLHQAERLIEGLLAEIR